jgi:hypothetical protein
MAIEIGRKYVIVNSIAGNDGKIVTVTGYACESKPGWVLGDRYYIEPPLMSSANIMTRHAGELQLKPIDDDSQEVGSWAALKDIWSPNPAVTA